MRTLPVTCALCRSHTWLSPDQGAGAGPPDALQRLALSREAARAPPSAPRVWCWKVPSHQEGETRAVSCPAPWRRRQRRGPHGYGRLLPCAACCRAAPSR